MAVEGLRVERINMKPIIFNIEAVRAIQDGRKTVTRRVIKPKYTNTTIISKSGKVFETVGTPATTAEIKFPYEAGDILYVRETYCAFNTDHIIDGVKYAYKADSTSESESVRKELGYKWLPSIHMPKEAARIFLKVTDVRVERLQDITEEQARAEGIGGYWAEPHNNEPPFVAPDVGPDLFYTRKEAFEKLWNSTVKKFDLENYGWEANPWVWVIKFERISKEETNGKENRA